MSPYGDSRFSFDFVKFLKKITSFIKKASIRMLELTSRGGYLTKPVIVHDVVDAIKKALDTA